MRRLSFAAALTSLALSAFAADGDSFTFATWNIGHFALGVWPPGMPVAKVPEMAPAYRDFLKRADADVIGLCENEEFIDVSNTCAAAEHVFSEYPHSSRDASGLGRANVFYWKDAECVKSGMVRFPNHSQHRFYRFVRLKIRGREVCFVETHLDWNLEKPGHANDRADQIARLVAAFKDEPCVVIGGDFNTATRRDGKWHDSPEDYEPFRKAGFAAAHWGEMKTWPAKAPYQSIDNVFVKGLTISEQRVMADASLSDHALLRCRLTFADSAPQKRNLLPNPEFDEPIPDATWKTKLDSRGQVLRQETMAMSGEWIIRSTGKSYLFMQATPQEFEPDTDYTMEIKARGFGGGDAALHILELYRRDSDGKVHEGAHVADRMPISQTFRTYYLPFRTKRDGRPVSIAFYKWSPRGDEDKGVDVASVRLYKGRMETLSIRNIDRTGRKAVVGEGLPIPANPYGRRRERVRALAFVSDIRGQREVSEVFAGLNAELDILVTTASDQDIYLCDGDPDVVEKKLKEGGYSLFCLDARAASQVGPIAAKCVEAAVKGGAGIYAAYDAASGRLAAILENADLKPMGADDPFVRSFPGKLRPGLAAADPAKDLLVGRYGSGRVVKDAKARPGKFKFMMDPGLYGSTDFPFSTFADPALAVLLFQTAGCAGATAAPAKTEWTVVDATGTLRKSGVASGGADAGFAAAKAAVDSAGPHAVALRMVDGDGYTVDWQARYFTKPGATVALEAVRASCGGDEPAVFRVALANGEMPPSGEISWTLEDFSGRVLARGTARAGSEFEVPTRSLYTDLGVVRARLVKNGRTLSAARANVYARDRDAARLLDDFTVGVWGQGGRCSRDTYTAIDRRLEDIGVRWQCVPVQRGRGYNLVCSLADGMSVSGGYLGESPRFTARKLDGRNIRSTYGAINTAAARTQIAKHARRMAEAAAPYGPVGYTVCDEPNLAQRFVPDEPDEEPENVAEFRARMERKYKTIGEYNRRHGTKRASFAEIGPMRLADARETGNFAEYVEWRNFNVDRWCEVLKLMTDAGRSVDPALRKSLFNSFGQTAASGNDYWKLLTRAGLDFSCEYTAMVYMQRDAIYNFDEFYRSFRPDMRVWGFFGYGMKGDQIAFAPWWFAAHRYGGLTWFSVTGWNYQLLDSPSQALTRDAADLKKAVEDSRLMDGLGKLFLAYDWAPRTAAIYYSHDSMLVSTLLGEERISFEVRKTGPLHDFMYSRQGAQYLLEDLLCQHDFVAPEQVVGGKLAGYRVLYMPRILALSDAEVAAVKAFLAKGGKVVADVLPGAWDELGVKRAANPFEGVAGITVLGRNFDDLDGKQRTATLKFLDAAGVTPVLRSPTIADSFGREAMHFTDGVNDVFPILRHPGRSQDEAEEVFEFPRGGFAWDVCARKALGRTDRVTTKVPRAGAAVFAVLPYEAKGVSIAAPKSVKAGEVVSVGVRLAAMGSPVGTHVFNVRFVPPSGECRFHFRRNVVAKGGVAHVDFPLAFNDERGAWKIVAEDALTGLRAERAFELR